MLIANLTKVLVERNPSAGPGAERAVGEAVQSIAQGATEGDSRLQQALDLLKANKISEAAQLLNAFAEDKMVRIEKDRKEAAIAYRNLGAIAGLADPKRALEAYEKALALDPDDVQSLLGAGWIQIDYGDLNKAQERLERVQKLAQSDYQTSYKYAAAGGLGEVKYRRGDLTGALQSYRDTIPIIDRLAKSDPGNAGWQRDLSVSHNRIGGVQQAQGDLAGALKSYEADLAISDRLARSDPGNAGWQRDLSVSYEKIGDVQKAQGDLAGALKSYSDSLAIRDRLARSDPGNAGWQRDLSVSYEKIGDVQQAQGDLACALKSYEADLAISDRLARSDPGNAGWQRDLAVTSGKLALVHRQLGDSAKARDYLRRSREIMARLTKLSPDNAQWKQGLAKFDREIAELAKR
ncbi:MAG: tetratricopeptide repeat protein [Methylocella sp.]